MSRSIPFVFFGFFLACTDATPPTPPAKPPAVPEKKLAAPMPTSDAGTADAKKLGMMERHAIWKAKKEADEKLAKELAEAEHKRLLKFDKGKLPKHLALIAFQKKTRNELESAAAKWKGKPDAAKNMEKLVAKQRKGIEAQGKLLRKLDPTGANSNIGTDHDVLLNLLAEDYPAAFLEAFAGNEKPISQVREEFERRGKKMTAWLDEARAFKK